MKGKITHSTLFIFGNFKALIAKMFFLFQIKMPNVYVRKSNKGSWSEEALQQAIEAIAKGMSIRSAGKEFNIPESTLRNRRKRNIFGKTSMGPESQLGVDAEKKLSLHITKLQAVGFAPTQRDVRTLAYNLAEALGKKHTFHKEKKMAGKCWFTSFLRRHPELSVRKAQGISRARTEGMNREEIQHYFSLLAEILAQNDLFDKPACIWNCDEIGVQLNNEPGKVVAVKGSKDVHVVTSAEKGETITILACCSAEGQFLPPYCIFKGVYAKPQHLKGAPPGTVIKMRKESAYINTELFMNWIREHFIPRKPAGKNLLILDGHASHMNSVDMLQLASDHDIVILCLPSHTTHYLQPLDRVVFKPFKTYFKNACAKLVATRRGTGRITRDDFGELLNSGWSRAATVNLATTAFRATGIYPLNMGAIPDHAYLLSCDQSTLGGDIGNPNVASSTPSSSVTSSSPVFAIATTANSTPPPTEATTSTESSSQQHSSSSELYFEPSAQATITLSSCTDSSRSSKLNISRAATCMGSDISAQATIPLSSSLSSCTDLSRTSKLNISSVSQAATCMESDITPNKALLQVSPIPCSLKVSKVKRKISATNVTSPEYINSKKKKTLTVSDKKRATAKKKMNAVTVKINKSRKSTNQKESRRFKPASPPSTSSEDCDQMEIVSDNVSETDGDACAECFESYSNTKSTSDWIKCISCARWLHESCTLYPQKCCDCGRSEIRRKNTKK